jgi:hypothetical protein
MTSMIRSIQPFLALGALFGTACYEYIPSHAPVSLVGQRVRLSLTDSGSVAMAGQVGPSVEAVEGTLVADSAGSYVLSTTLTRVRGGVETDWRGEHVRVAHPLVAMLAERRFSGSRSTFAGVLMAGGITAVTVSLRGRGGATGGGVPNPGTPAPK